MWIPCESKKDKEIVDMTFAENLKMLRKQAGMSQEQLAEKLGVTIGTIGYYERGAGMPKTDNLFALCDILHIRPADLLRADS